MLLAFLQNLLRISSHFPSHCKLHTLTETDATQCLPKIVHATSTSSSFVFFSLCVFSSTFTTPVATCRLLLLHYCYILYSYRHRCLRDTLLLIRLVVTKDIITHPISTIKTRLQVQVATGIWSRQSIMMIHDASCIMHHATSVIEPCCILRIHGPVMILLYEGPFQDMQSKCTFFLAALLPSNYEYCI